MKRQIGLPDAQTLYGELRDIAGVQSIVYDEEENYKNVSALYTITFDYSETDDRRLETLDAVKAHLSGQDIYVSTALGGEAIRQTVEKLMGKFKGTSPVDAFCGRWDTKV